ncbi:MAG: hypothetical protein ACP5FT_04225 [Acidilobus sp.]
MEGQPWPALLLPWLVAIALSVEPARLDLLYREVPEEFWVVGSKIGFAVSLITYLRFYGVRTLAAYYGLSLIGASAVGLASALGLMGQGDFLAVLALSLTIPAPFPGSALPPIYLVIIIASIAEVTARALIALRTCGSLRCVGGAEVTCERLIAELRWWFPVGADFTSDVPSEAAVRACQGGRGSVKAQPGLPYVTFILLALPLALVVDALIRVP